MVDSINSQTTSTTVSGTKLNSTATNGVSSPAPTEKDPLALESTRLSQPIPVNTVGSSPAVTLLVSKESQEKANQDLAISKLVRKANAVKEPYNQEKVDHFKKLLQDPQALSKYLNSVDTNAIASSILTNAEGTLLS